MICRLCLNKSTIEVLNIFDAEGIRLQIADIISKHFWFSPSKDDPISDKICCSCWTKVNNFHEFYCFVEIAHKNLTNITDSSSKVQLHNVKEEHIFTSDSDEDVNNVLDIELTENFEIVFNKQDPIADIKVDEDAKFGITFENNSSKTKIQRKSNLNKQCDNEKNKEQFEENSTTDEETTKNRKNSQSKKFKASQKIQTKSKTAKNCLTENFEVVLNKQDSIADINVDTNEDAETEITLENNSSTTKNRRKSSRNSNLYNHCEDNEKYKEQLEENSTTDEETTKNQKYSRLKKSKTSIIMQTKSRFAKKLKKESPDSDNDDAVNENNTNTTPLIPKSNQNKSNKQVSKQRKRKIKKKKLDTDDDDDKQDPEKIAQKKKIKEEDELIAQYIRMNCDNCSQSFSTFLQLKSHNKKAHNRIGYVKCCNKKIYKRFLLLDHVNFHIDPNVFSCTVCDKKFKNHSTLKYHIASHNDANKSELFSCDQCQKQFVKKSTLDNHKLIHAPPEERHFKCEICQKTYATSAILKFHIRSVHERKYDLVCDICAKKLPCKKLLEKHRLEHDGITEPKVQCPQCGSWHKGERNLKKHMLYHNRPLYTCEICGIQASRKFSIARHIENVHKNQRNFKCAICEKAFNRNKTLIEHMTTHTGDILYTCTFCPQTFNSSANMYSHRKKIHPKEWEELNKKRMNPIPEATLTSYLQSNFSL